MNQNSFSAKISSAIRPLVLLFASSIIITTNLSCKKQTSVNTNPDHKMVSNHLAFSVIGLQYIRPPLNSYFIYKDSATGIIDSVVITDNTIEEKFSPKHVDTLPGFYLNTAEIDDHYYQSIRLEYTKFTGSSAINWLNFADEDNRDELSLYGTPDSSIVLMEWDSTFSIESPLYYFSYPPTYWGVTKIPNTVIGQKTYYDIINFHYEWNGNPSDSLKNVDYYWARGIGLIKRREITTNTTHSWSLIRNG